VNFIGALLLLVSEERKAFLLRGVNKANKLECQGRLKHLGKKKAWTKKSQARKDPESGRERTKNKILLTGSELKNEAF